MEIFYNQSNYEVIPLNKRTNVRFYTSADPGSYVPPHWHDAVEIVYLQEGELTFTIERHSRTIHPGQCILVNPNVIHTTQCTAPNTAIVFQIPLPFLTSLVPDAHQRFFYLDNRGDDPLTYVQKIDRFTQTLREMQRLNDTRPPLSILQFNSLLYDIIFQLCDRFSVQVFQSSPDQKKHILDRLTPILNYTAQHYSEPISIQEISEIAALNPTYFCRFFKKAMGITFLEYQQELRLSHILQDLITTDESIGLILERHGFTNYKLFCRVFRAHFKATPSQIRKQLKKTAAVVHGKKGD